MRHDQEACGGHVSPTLQDREKVTSATHARNDSLVTPHCRMVYFLLQSSLIVRIGLCAAAETELLAQVVSSLPADCTLTAGNANLQGYPVANLEAADLRADSYHLAC